MDSSKAGTAKELPVGLDEATEEEYASQSKLLQEFTNIRSIDKAWVFKSESGRKANVSSSFSFVFLFLFKTKTLSPIPMLFFETFCCRNRLPSNVFN